jgi:hypothetical protein
MQNDFIHIESQIVRDICAGTMAPTRVALAYAIGWTGACFEEDRKSQCIPFWVRDARELFLHNAKSAFIDDIESDCVKALQSFWSV